ncbi:MAG: hypothetical protein ACFFD4_36850 [Candidatus Odinarchaeota archaeon]
MSLTRFKPLNESRIVELLDIYLRDNFYITERELVINSNQIDLTKIAGQSVLRIDLAATSRLDGSIIFIEAENEAYLEHPLIYGPMADYLFLACPLSKLESDDVNPVIIDDLFRSAISNQAGVLGVFEPRNEGDVCFYIKRNAPLLPLRGKIRKAVLASFKKRGNENIETLIPWWAVQ